MAPRIIESDDESEFDDLSNLSDSSEEGSSKLPAKGKAAASNAAKGKSKASTSTPAKAAAAAAATATATPPARASGRASTAQKEAASSSTVPPVYSTRPAARRAAIKANQSMDVDAAVASDEDEGEELDAAGAEEDDDLQGEQDEDEDDEGDDEEDADDDDDDADEYSEASPAPGRAQKKQQQQQQQQQQQPAMKLKFKMGHNQSGGANPPSSPGPAAAASPTVISLKNRSNAAPAPSSSPSGVKLTVKGGSAKKGAANSTKSAKRKRDDMSDLGDDDEEEAEAAGQDTLAGEDDDEDFLSDSGESAVSLSKMTARQRAAHIGAEPELMELPQAPSKKKVLTEDEVAMRKVETSRRRKHLLNKKLEEEKTETIERLLKKPIGRRAGASTSRLAAATKVDRSTPPLPIPGGVDEHGNPVPADVQTVRIPTEFRWISSIKDGQYRAVWAVPPNYEGKFTWPSETLPTLAKIQEVTGGKPPEITYPPPRPPPQSRPLKA